MAIRTRDQQYARLAYGLVEGVNEKKDEYKIAVNGLGINILRMGLVAAIAELQRRGEKGGDQLLEHLAASHIPGLPSQGDGIAGAVRAMSTDHYMLVTREVLQYVSWLKRAVQASFD